MIKFLRIICIIFSFLTILNSCKKTDKSTTTNTPPPPPPPPPPVSSDVLKDSVLLLTRDFYLWYNQIPSTFNPKTYEDPAKIMEAIHPFSVETGFSTPVDKWSFGIKKTEWDNLTSGMNSVYSALNADGDLGLYVFFKQEGDLRVRQVERLSPAGMAGIQRSWRITKINGSTDITTGNAQYIIDNIYNSKSSTITFIKPDGTSVDISLTAAHYKTQPVYLDSVYTINNKNIGYLVFNSFIGDTSVIYSELQRVFNKFSDRNVNDVIIDLRYNGGGYVSVQERLANYLAPQSADGSLMMKEQYNDKHSQYNFSTFFHKTGPLNLSKIYFIVSRNTASASELLINNLKPFMDVKLVGPSHTHGKPVGFFPLSVGEWYIFPISFRTTNKDGIGNYFNGLDVANTVADGLDQNWGNVLESSLASALKHITTGVFTREILYQENPLVQKGNTILNELSFTGMIRNPKTK